MNVNPSISSLVQNRQNMTSNVATQGQAQSVDTASTAATPNQPSPGQPSDTATAAAVHKLNQQLAQTNMQIEFDATAPANQLWLNVVDKSTGSVIQKIPPEGVRKLVENPNAGGLLMDKPF